MALEYQELRTKAYLRCDKAMRWLLSKSSELDPGKYLDEYVAFLDAPKAQRIGPMTYAEAILTFYDVFDWSNSASGVRSLPCLNINQFIIEINNLIDCLGKVGFKGMPYLWENAQKDQEQVDFTDAACFIGLACHVSLEHIKEWKKQPESMNQTEVIEQNLVQAYKKCIRWLLDNRIQHPGLFNLYGWGWSGCSGVERYGQQFVPPQTYFTCSSIITLSEAVTYHMDLFENEIELIIEAIDQARQLISKSRVAGNGRPGWIDFIPVSDKYGNFQHSLANTLTLNKIRPELIQRSELHSFYIFEAFGYLHRNLKRLLEQTQIKHRDKFVSMLERVESESRDIVEPSVQSILIDIEEASENWQAIIRTPARNLLPKNVNERQDNYYVDGSTLANCWNAFEVFCREALNKDLSNRWESIRSALIEELLNASGTDGGFPSLVMVSEMETGKSYSALYATRSSINTLIKYGLEPPPEENREAVQEVVNRLTEARKAIDDAKDRLILLRGEDLNVFSKTDYMAAYHFANALNEFEFVTLELCNKDLGSNMFVLSSNADRDHPTFENTPDTCRAALKKYRKQLVELVNKENEAEFNKAVDRISMGDMANLPLISRSRLGELLIWANNNRDSVAYAYARFTKLTDIVKSMASELRKQL